MALAVSNKRSAINITAPVAWAVMLLVSSLPDIIFTELTGSLPAWLYWVKLALVAASLLLSLSWDRLQPLRLFFIVLLALYLIEWGVIRLFDALGYASWFTSANSFIQQVGMTQLPRVTAAILMVFVMLVVFRRFDRFFLVKGQLDAPAQPIPFILTRPPSWRVLGPAIAGAMCLGLVIFIFLMGISPPPGSLSLVLPLLPFVLIFAASNAFGEEALYRAPWLAALEIPVGPAHALLITATYFGIEHYYGVPYGVLGCLMAFIPGWLNGKAMLETRGFFWAWFIHFWMDVVIFFFMALGAVAPAV
jgi:hypothetical protein